MTPFAVPGPLGKEGSKRPQHSSYLGVPIAAISGSLEPDGMKRAQHPLCRPGAPGEGGFKTATTLLLPECPDSCYLGVPRAGRHEKGPITPFAVLGPLGKEGSKQPQHSSCLGVPIAAISGSLEPDGMKRAQSPPLPSRGPWGRRVQNGHNTPRASVSR